MVYFVSEVSLYIDIPCGYIYYTMYIEVIVASFAISDILIAHNFAKYTVGEQNLDYGLKNLNL